MNLKKRIFDHSHKKDLIESEEFKKMVFSKLPLSDLNDEEKVKEAILQVYHFESIFERELQIVEEDWGYVLSRQDSNSDDLPRLKRYVENMIRDVKRTFASLHPIVKQEVLEVVKDVEIDD